MQRLPRPSRLERNANAKRLDFSMPRATRSFAWFVSHCASLIVPLSLCLSHCASLIVSPYCASLIVSLIVPLLLCLSYCTCVSLCLSHCASLCIAHSTRQCASLIVCVSLCASHCVPLTVCSLCNRFAATTQRMCYSAHATTCVHVSAAQNRWSTVQFAERKLFRALRYTASTCLLSRAPLPFSSVASLPFLSFLSFLSCISSLSLPLT